VFIEAKDDGRVGDNWTTGGISRAKLQSNHHREINIMMMKMMCSVTVANERLIHVLTQRPSVTLTLDVDLVSDCGCHRGWTGHVTQVNRRQRLVLD